MIVIRLQGGLGNQLFQYAAARRLAYQHKTEVVIEDSYFSDSRNGHTQWQYDLGNLNVALRFPTTGERKSFLPYCRHPWRLLRTVVSLPGRYRYVRERHFHFDPRILHLPDNVFLDGYWQSEKYFVDIDDLLRTELSFRDELSPEEKNFANAIKASSAVSIHVRRGDYVTNPRAAATHGTCSLDYYQRAASYMKERIGSPTYFVFSDDPEWALRHMTFLSAGEHVVNVQTKSGFRDLRLMSLCKHNIIANSSFSWWGAWLNTHARKIVVAPQKWFATGQFNTHDLIPCAWVRV